MAPSPPPTAAGSPTRDAMPTGSCSGWVGSAAPGAKRRSARRPAEVAADTFSPTAPEGHFPECSCASGVLMLGHPARASTGCGCGTATPAHAAAIGLPHANAPKVPAS